MKRLFIILVCMLCILCCKAQQVYVVTTEIINGSRFKLLLTHQGEISKEYLKKEGQIYTKDFKHTPLILYSRIFEDLEEAKKFYNTIK